MFVSTSQDMDVLAADETATYALRYAFMALQIAFYLIAQVSLSAGWAPSKAFISEKSTSLFPILQGSVLSLYGVEVIALIIDNLLVGSSYSIFGSTVSGPSSVDLMNLVSGRSLLPPRCALYGISLSGLCSSQRW